MPVHDWGRVDAGIFHDFHHAWIEEIKRVLNSGALPFDYYAMAEQQAGCFGPDVLTLQVGSPSSEYSTSRQELSENVSSLVLTPPQVKLIAESDMEFYRRKQNSVVVRHISGDRIVAVIEIISRGNKSSHVAMKAFIDKVTHLLLQGVHLLVLDLQMPGPRDPNGIHGAIWYEMTSQEYWKPEKPLTLAAYESGPAGVSTRAYVQPIAVGETLPDMPLFLKQGAHVPLALESTYLRAYAALPKRWQSVLDS